MSCHVLSWPDRTFVRVAARQMQRWLVDDDTIGNAGLAAALCLRHLRDPSLQQRREARLAAARVAAEDDKRGHRAMDRAMDGSIDGSVCLSQG